MEKKALIPTVACIIILLVSIAGNLWLWTSLNQANSKITTLETMVNTKNSEIETLETTIGTHESEKATLEGIIDSLESTINELESQRAELWYTIESLESKIDELEGARLEENIQVKGWGWIEEAEGWVWRERVYGRILNIGLKDAYDISLTVRWYLGEELVGIKLFYLYFLGKSGGVWEIDEYFTLDEQPDFHEVELSWK